MEEPIYSDSLVSITPNNILFKHYNLFGRDKLVDFSQIEYIVVNAPTVFNGKFRFHGTGDFKIWFAKDLKRYKRDKIFTAYIRNKWWRIGFTAESSADVIKIFRKKGLVRRGL